MTMVHWCWCPTGKGKYYEGFKKVVDSSDVILQVLDARDPCSCRCLEVERYVRKVDANKRIVLVLNKIGTTTKKLLNKTPSFPVLLFVCWIRLPLPCNSTGKPPLRLSGGVRHVDLGACGIICIVPRGTANNELSGADLVPPEVVRKWLVHLREELPAVAFKAATKKKGVIKQIRMPRHVQASDSSGKGTSSTDLETSECLGADSLVQLLKNYSRSNDVKSVISVGVVGLPNVGKSSVINSLKRSNVSHTGNAPGITKSVQEIHLDKHIRLLDSPGLVTSTADNPAAEALYGGVKVRWFCANVSNR